MTMKAEREQGAGGNVIELLRQVARQPPPPVTIARRQSFLFSLSLSLISYLLSRYYGYDEILRLKIEKK